MEEDFKNKILRYRYQTPKEITNGNMGIKIAFYNSKGEKIYFNSRSFAHQLPEFDILNFVYFTKDNNMACFYEIEIRKSFKFKIIDFIEKVVYEIDLIENTFNIKEFCELIKKNNNHFIQKKIKNYNGFSKSIFINDNLKINFFNSWKWKEYYSPAIPSIG